MDVRNNRLDNNDSVGPVPSPAQVPAVRVFVATPEVHVRFAHNAEVFSMADLGEVLELVQGSTKEFDFVFHAKKDALEDLSGATAATLTIKKSVEDVSNILQLTSPVAAGSGLTIDIPNSKVRGTITQAQADALPPGAWIGQLSVKVSGLERKTRKFAVIVRRSFVPNNP